MAPVPVKQANLMDLIAATGLVTSFGLCDLEVGPMALKNNRDILPCPFQFCVSFHSHQCIRLGCLNRVKTGILLSPMTTKLDRWHWKTIGHLSYASFSFMHYFVVISEFKFELQCGNAQIRSILAIFGLLWPWNCIDDHKKGISSMFFQALCIISHPSVNLDLSYSPETLKLGKNWRFFASCDL